MCVTGREPAQYKDLAYGNPVSVAARNDKRPDLQSSYSWAHNK